MPKKVDPGATLRLILRSRWFVGAVGFLLGFGLMFAYSDFLLRQEWAYSAKMRDRVLTLEQLVPADKR